MRYVRWKPVWPGAARRPTETGVPLHRIPVQSVRPPFGRVYNPDRLSPIHQSHIFASGLYSTHILHSVTDTTHHQWCHAVRPRRAPRQWWQRRDPNTTPLLHCYMFLVMFRGTCHLRSQPTTPVDILGVSMDCFVRGSATLRLFLTFCDPHILPHHTVIHVCCSTQEGSGPHSVTTV